MLNGRDLQISLTYTLYSRYQCLQCRSSTVHVLPIGFSKSSSYQLPKAVALSEPYKLVATHMYRPQSAGRRTDSTSRVLSGNTTWVGSGDTGVPSWYHWTLSGGSPDALQSMAKFVEVGSIGTRWEPAISALPGPEIHPTV